MAEQRQLPVGGKCDQPIITRFHPGKYFPVREERSLKVITQPSVYIASKKDELQ